MTIEEKAKAYDNVVNKLRRFMEHGINPLITRTDVQDFFPELAESEDERIRKSIIAIINNYVDNSNTFKPKMIAWLEKQATKSVNIDIESMVSQYKQRLKSQGGVENTPIVNMCLTAFRHGVENVLEELNLKKLEKQVEKKPASSAKTCENDTLLDLLQKMPSCITVDGIDYHFVMKKTSIYIAYYACYKGNGEEGRGNAIFGITAHSPIDLLTEMLEILKEKGLLK